MKNVLLVLGSALLGAMVTAIGLFTLFWKKSER